MSFPFYGDLKMGDYVNTVKIIGINDVTFPCVYVNIEHK